VARIAVAATAPFGADVLERLAQRHDVVQVLTRPDRPRGRGRKVAPPPAKLVADRLGIPVSQPERLDASVELDADTVVVVAYGLLVPESLLERALWLNVHPSLLPRWRGAAPVERAIMAGDEESGVSIIKLVKELDAGPVAAWEEIYIPIDWTAGDFYAYAAGIAENLLTQEALQEADFFPQPEVGLTYAEKITAADRAIDWSRPAKEIHDRIRGLSPHIGARGIVDGRELIVWRSRLDDDHVELLEVQPPGGRRMTYEEYLRGLR
jgi:methionyl-tRNA formyltransferase